MLGQPYAGDAVVHVGGMQLKRSVALQDLADARQTVKVVLDALHGHHGLALAIDGQRLVFHAFRGHLHLWQLAHLHQQRVVGRGGLAFGGRQL